MIKRVLDNGLTLLIEKRKDSPVAAVVTHVKTGYFDEADEYVGISHVFEHMFFKGTTRRPKPEDIAQETKSLGGIVNAGTGYEATSYYAVIPAKNFEKSLDIQFDALTDPLLDPDELQKEIEVVIQEARQKLDNRSAYSLEKMWELAFDLHRIRRWKIGYPDQLRTITREDLLRYYEERYTPDNIIVCIVGGVDSERAFQIAKRYYSQIPPRPLVPNPSPKEGQQRSIKFVRLKGDISQKLLKIGFHAPSILDSDYYPLSVAVDILGRGRSSRLHQSIVEQKQLSNAIGAFYGAYEDVGVATVSAEVLTDDPSELTACVFQEIEKLKKNCIDRSEIEKIKARLESDVQFQQEQALGRASRIAYYEALGDWRLSEESIERLRAVQPEDVARAAKEYLNIDRATVLEYVPQQAKLRDYDATVLSEEIRKEISVCPTNGTAKAVQSDKTIDRVVFPSGAVLITEVVPESPVVGVAVMFRGGRTLETRETAGITELALSTSLKGTTKYPAEEIARRIESLGTSIGTSNHSDYFGYTLRILDKHFDEGFELLSDVIADAAFPLEEIEKEKEAQRADIKRVQDSSFACASELLLEIAFPDHPYGYPDYGWDETVAALAKEQVAQWHKRSTSSGNAVVSVVGNVDVELVRKAVQNLLMRLEASTAKPRIPTAAFPSGITENSITRKRAQTAAAIAFHGVTADDPDRYALDVIGALTSGLGGRLFAEVRGRLGLAYVVQSGNQSVAGGGIFIVYSATSPEYETAAREAIFRELGKLGEELASTEEIERAKNYIRGTRLIALQISVAKAREHTANEFYGRGLNGTDVYLKGIAAVTAEDILNASREYFNPSRYCLGVVRSVQ